MRTTSPALGVRLFAVSAILLASACRGEAPKPAEKPEPSRTAEFKTGEIRGINAADRPEAAGKSSEEAPKIVSLLNDFYNTAFLDKAKWSNGTHPGLAAFFTQEAQSQLSPNLGALALADLAPKLREVTPTKQEATKISFLVEDDLSTPVGVVSTVFEANATEASKSQSPVKIVHNASFWIVWEGGSYKIYAYSSELKADSTVRSAAFGTPEQGRAG